MNNLGFFTCRNFYDSFKTLKSCHPRYLLHSIIDIIIIFFLLLLELYIRNFKAIMQHFLGYRSHRCSRPPRLLNRGVGLLYVPTAQSVFLFLSGWILRAHLRGWEGRGERGKKSLGSFWRLHSHRWRKNSRFTVCIKS